MTAKISSLRITPGDSQLIVSWVFGGSGANATLVKWRTSSITPWAKAKVVELPTSTVSYTITGLSAGQSYNVQVVPVMFGSGSQTATATPVTSGVPLPIPPLPVIS